MNKYDSLSDQEKRLKGKMQKLEFADKLSKAQRLKLRIFSGYFLTQVVWLIFRLVLLVGVAYIILYPFITKIAGSFMSAQDFTDVTVKLISKYPTWDQYRVVINENRYFEAFFNTLTLSLLCALIQMTVCAFVGYGFAKFKFKGNNILFLCVVFTMIVPHETLQLAMFMKFRYFDILNILGISSSIAQNAVANEYGIVTSAALGDLPALMQDGFINLLDSYWPLGILSIGGLAFKNGLYIFMMRQFFKGVPDELEEAAYVDGSGVFKTYVRIILPLSVPMMITVFLFSFAWQWTDTFYTNLFFNENVTWLLPNIISVPKGLGVDPTFSAYNLYKSAVTNTCGLLIILPLIILYCFAQRYLIQGIERSGIVG
jgi:multiple sugar transport system permease protein